MGLDLIELVMQVEEEFHIEIDQDASQMQTVGQMYQFICRKVGSRLPTDRCDSMFAFHRVRDALVNTGISAASEIHPETDLSAWASASPEAWNFFMRSLDLNPIAP